MQEIFLSSYGYFYTRGSQFEIIIFKFWCIKRENYDLCDVELKKAKIMI